MQVIYNMQNKGGILLKRTRFLAAVLAAAMTLSAVSSMSVSAVSSMVETSYIGANVEEQGYTNVKRWSQPITSYLTDLGNGQLMRVQTANIDESDPASKNNELLDKVLVEYYDSSYNLTKSLIVEDELDKFGGFYAMNGYYYIVTGQENPNEDDNVEVFRITKYDSNWNKIKSCSLYGANTTVPFDAGSLRMTEYGNYLIIRTSHEMYAIDGINHQANVTIIVDTSTMTIKDKLTSILNEDYGYVSHSFNQFIQVEDGKIVALDHGDYGTTRGAVILKYKNSVSNGLGTSSMYNVIKFPDDIGDSYNDTGCTLGGFEISDSKYLIAGTNLKETIQLSDNSAVRNVFVAAADKSNPENVTMNYITSYTESSQEPNNPQFVKVSDNKYLLLWSRNNYVYYQFIDGSGEKIGSNYSMKGNLSDCVPIVSNNKVIWYVWDNNDVIFYEINVDSPANTNSVNVEDPHEYTCSSVTNGQVTVKCSECGLSKTVSVITAINSVLWNYNQSSYYSRYSSSMTTNLNIGDELRFMVSDNYITAANDAVKDVEVTVADPSILSVERYYGSTGDILGKFTALKAGTTQITIAAKYNPSVKKTYTIKVSGDIRAERLFVQKTAVSGGKYSTRYVMLVDEQTAENTSSVEMVFDNGKKISKKTSTCCYKSIKAADSTLTAPDGYSYVAVAITGIPEGLTLDCTLTLS